MGVEALVVSLFLVPDLVFMSFPTEGNESSDLVEGLRVAFVGVVVLDLCLPFFFLPLFGVLGGVMRWVGEEVVVDVDMPVEVERVVG